MKVKLEDVAEKIFAGGDVPKNRFSDIRTEEYCVPIYANAEKDDGLYGYTNEARVYDESVTVAARGTIGFCAIRREPFLPVVRLITVIPKKEEISLEYLYYALRNCKPKSSGTSIPQLTVPDIKKYTFNLVALEEQERIATLLHSVEEIICKRKEQLAGLNELVKARFVEMFGDPVINPREWDIKAVIDVCDCMVPGRDKPKSFSGDIPWITIDDLIINGVTCESKARLGLTEEEIAEVKRKTVPTNSVLMSCVGNLGICSIAGSNLVINQQLHSFQCSEKINNYFLMHQLGWKKDYMNKHASSTTVLYMNKAVCNSIPIILPPIELQNQFADFVQQVNKSKFEVQKSLDEIQTLMDSLMQKYLG